MPVNACLWCANDGRRVAATAVVDGDPLCTPCRKKLAEVTAAQGGAAPAPAPGKRMGYCVPCGTERRDVEAVALLDGDPVCAMHARLVGETAADPAGEPAMPCDRGCGNARHRGRCKGEKTGRRQPNNPAGLQVVVERAQVAEIPKPAALRPKKAKVVLDTLQAEVIHDDDIPAEAPVHVRNVGRLGQIWRDLDTLAPKQNLKIANRDRNHMSYTARCLRKGAKRRHLRLRIRELGTFLIVRFLSEGEEA